MTIKNLKQHIDIIDVVGDYTELIGTGNRQRAKENPVREGGDFDVYKNSQRWYDQGTGEGGDICDFIESVENLNKTDARSFLVEKYLNGVDVSSNYVATPRREYKPIKKDNELLLVKIKNKASQLLQAMPHMSTVNSNRIAKEKYRMVEVHGVNTIILAPIFEKLFEGYLIPTDEKFARYLFNKVIGYDSYFNCPVIVLRDESETVIDIIRYRPERSGEPLMQREKPLKYLNINSNERPDIKYLFPLSAQMIKIMFDQGYCYVGEGLKNSVNASLAGVPFISIEGAGSVKPELIEFLKSDRMKDITLIGALDGDAAGEQAYKKIREYIDISKNMFDFDSKQDFADYLRELRKDEIDESKRAS